MFVESAQEAFRRGDKWSAFDANDLNASMTVQHCTSLIGVSSLIPTKTTFQQTHTAHHRRIVHDRRLALLMHLMPELT